MDALREGSGGLPDGVAEDYYRKYEASYRVAGRVVHVETIVTVPALWPDRPESSDPSWTMHRDAMPLVVATRIVL